MIPQSDSRLAIAAAFLSFLFIIFVFELAFTVKFPASSTLRRQNRFTRLRHFVAPVSIGLLGAILIPLMFTGKTAERASITHIEICDVEVDADIGGDGIRIAIWVQESVLLLIALLGTFHCSATGAKEIGAGLALTHVSLVIALLVQLGRGSLTSADAILGSMIIDSQCSALSMQLVAKETLASRWQVVAIIVCQILGLTVLPILVDGFGKGKFATEDCSCVAVFWWGWLSDCSAFVPREMAIFWTYYACRCVAFLQCCYHSLSNTIQFHDAEKHGTRLEGITYPTMNVPDLESPDDGTPNDADSASEDEELLEQEAKANGSRYPHYPATVSLMYTVYGLFALVSMAAAEIAMRDYGLRPSSQLFSVGQIIGMVVAGATIVRGLYLFIMMLLAGGAGFTWPFSFEVGLEVAGFGSLSRGTYVLLPRLRKDSLFPQMGDALDRALRLGNIVRKTSDLPEQILMVAEPDSLEENHARKTGGDGEVTIDVSFGKSISLRFEGGGVTWSHERTLSIRAHEIELRWFRPTPGHLARCLRDPGVRRALRWGQVYMITGIMVGTDLKIGEHEKTSDAKEAKVPVPDVGVNIGFEAEKTTSAGNDTNHSGRVIFAYQLSVIRKPWFSNWVGHEVLVPEGGALAFNWNQVSP